MMRHEDLRFILPRGHLPTMPDVWLDLHVSDDYYQHCRRRQSQQIPDKRGWREVYPPPATQGRSLLNSEVVGLDCSHTAVVVNVASKAKHGLIVAPGKLIQGSIQGRWFLWSTTSRIAPFCFAVATDRMRRFRADFGFIKGNFLERSRERCFS